VTTGTGSFLERIVAAARRRLAAQQGAVPLDVLRARVAAAPGPRDFTAALTPEPLGSARLIAEVKRASPSKGLLTADFEPVARAKDYQAGGAAAISVLTEPDFFRGALAHLTAVREAVRLPVLCKDFILDPYQVYEARAAGADALLLICALLDDVQLRELLDLTHALGMEALVEAHDANEARRAVDVGARVIGVNSRDLRTFAVDPDIVSRVRPVVPVDRVLVAESGIADTAGAVRARAAGAQVILVGEALMRERDPRPLVRGLASAGGWSAAQLFALRPRPFVKLCGMREPEQAEVAVEAGADAIGLIYAPARRQVSAEQARAIGAAARAHAARYDAPRSILTIGVFVDPPLDAVCAADHEVRLDAIQLSGAEQPEMCMALIRETGRPVIKALRPSTLDDLDRLADYSAAGAALLIEPGHGDGPGGNGRTGDWALAHAAAGQWPMILAGGLTPDNVGEAIRAVTPRGVDVSSGTETADVKDPTKLRAFVRAAREATAQHTAAAEARSQHGA
jgi:indole-3-glycerol phosphate synthase/phosphoribosylanthranilate isomerase/anthranilate synthase/indole-3-glycerol phosphate synthase/phosphoribosylanthranilate isomerase